MKSIVFPDFTSISFSTQAFTASFSDFEAVFQPHLAISNTQQGITTAPLHLPIPELPLPHHSSDRLHCSTPRYSPAARHLLLGNTLECPSVHYCYWIVDSTNQTKGIDDMDAAAAVTIIVITEVLTLPCKESSRSRSGRRFQ